MVGDHCDLPSLGAASEQSGQANLAKGQRLRRNQVGALPAAAPVLGLLSLAGRFGTATGAGGPTIPVEQSDDHRANGDRERHPEGHAEPHRLDLGAIHCPEHQPQHGQHNREQEPRQVIRMATPVGTAEFLHGAQGAHPPQGQQEHGQQQLRDHGHRGMDPAHPRGPSQPGSLYIRHLLKHVRPTACGQYGQEYDDDDREPLLPQGGERVSDGAAGAVPGHEGQADQEDERDYPFEHGRDMQDHGHRGRRLPARDGR